MEYGNIFIAMEDHLKNVCNYSEDEFNTLVSDCNKQQYIELLAPLEGSEISEMANGCNIAVFSVQKNVDVGGDKFLLIYPECTAFFTVQCGKPWILLNADTFSSVDVLRHELIHYAQWKRGDYVMNNDGTVLWKGEVYTAERIAEAFTPENIAYQWKFLPWETEAYGYQFLDEEVRHIRDTQTPGVVGNLKELLGLVGRVIN